MEQNQKGITLVALIFTIVILFILATVSIKSIIDGRIFSKTKSAKELYSQAEEEEMIRIAANNAKIDGNSKIQTKYLTSTLNEQFGDDWEILYIIYEPEGLLNTVTKANYKNTKNRTYLAKNNKNLYGMIVQSSDKEPIYLIIRIKSSKRKYQIFENADVNSFEKDVNNLSEIDKVGMAAYEAKNGGDKVNEELLKTALNKYFKDDWEWVEDSLTEMSDSKEKNIFNNIKLCNKKGNRVKLGQKSKNLYVAIITINKLYIEIKIKSTENVYFITQKGEVSKKELGDTLLGQ